MSNMQGMTVGEWRIKCQIRQETVSMALAERRWRECDAQIAELMMELVRYSDKRDMCKVRLSVLTRKLEDAKPEGSKRRR